MTSREALGLACIFAPAWTYLYFAMAFWADEDFRRACEAVFIEASDPVPLMRSVWG